MLKVCIEKKIGYVLGMYFVRKGVFQTLVTLKMWKVDNFIALRVKYQNRDQHFKIGTNIWEMVHIGTVPINRDYCGHTDLVLLMSKHCTHLNILCFSEHASKENFRIDLVYKDRLCCAAVILVCI
jgi:hypothetical protein